MLTTLQLASCMLPSNFGSAAAFTLWDTDCLGGKDADAAAAESVLLQDSSSDASTPQHAIMQTSSGFSCITAGQQQHHGMFLRQCSTENSPQLQHGFGADSLVPVVLQDGSVVSVLPQDLCADFPMQQLQDMQASTAAPMQLQDMQAQQHHASTATPVLLQDGTIVLLSSSGQQQQQTEVTQVQHSSAGSIFLQQQQTPTQQQQHQGARQQQVVVISSQGVCAGPSTSSSAGQQQPLIVLQGSNTGSSQQMSTLSCGGPFDQPQQLLQLPAQQQHHQQQQQVFMLAPGEQLVCTSGPMQHHQVVIAGGSSGASTLQLLGSCSAQAGSCAGGGQQQQQQQQVILRAEPAGGSTQQLQLQGISGQLPSGQHVLVCTQGGNNGQIVQGQVLQVQGPIMQGTTVLMQGNNATMLQPAANQRDSSGNMCFPSGGQTSDHRLAGSTFLAAGSGTMGHHYSCTGSDSGSNISSPTQLGRTNAPTRAMSAGALRAGPGGMQQQQGPSSCMRPPSAGHVGGSSNSAAAKGGGNKSWPYNNSSDGLGLTPGNSNTPAGSNSRSTVGLVSAAMHGGFKCWEPNQRLWGGGGNSMMGGQGPKQGVGSSGPPSGFGGGLPAIQRQPSRSSQLPKQPVQGLARIGQSGCPTPNTGSSTAPPGNNTTPGEGAPSPRGPLPPWATATVQDGLPQLWSGEQLARARGGRMFNIQQLAWHPAEDPAPGPADLYNFQKLKRIIQKLDAMHKVRAQLIKRIHAVAESAGGDLKAVYRDVRGLIGLMLQDASMQIKSLSECRVVGLIRLALMLQVALEQGPEPTLLSTLAGATLNTAEAPAAAAAPAEADTSVQPSQVVADAAAAAAVVEGAAASPGVVSGAAAGVPPAAVCAPVLGN